MKKIFLVTIFLLLSISCSTYKKQLAQLDSNINKFGRYNNIDSSFNSIPEFENTDYNVQIMLGESMTRTNPYPYSNDICIRLNNKQSIAYWIREYNTVKDSLGQEFTYETNMSYYPKLRRDIITIYPDKKSMKKLLSYILQKKVCELKRLEEIIDKCHVSVYVDDPMLSFGISIENKQKYCFVSYQTPSEYADSCPELADLKIFLEAIEVIRASIGANKTFSSTIK